MEVLNVDKLINMLREYQDIPKSIERKQKILQIKLCDPMTTVENGISAFVSTENEINFLIKKWRLISKIISELDDVDIQVVDGLMKGKSIFAISDDIKMSRRTVFREIAKVKHILQKKVTFDCIYKFEEGVAYE